MSDMVQNILEEDEKSREDFYARQIENTTEGPAQIVEEPESISKDVLLEEQESQIEEAYDMFKMQLGENAETSESRSYKGKIAIGKISNNKVVYFERGTEDDEVNLVLRQNNKNSKSVALQKVKTDQYVMKVLKFSRFIDGVLGSNIHEELQSDIISRVAEGKNATSKEMVKDNEAYALMLKGYMK
ncbi:MAG: hypothetical protein K6D97_01630 [Clostridia bacterium]|nr:hypothetical protein [Clostridia bacterium]